MSLTAKQVESAKTKGKDVKLFDGGGLFLLVKKSGGRWWRLKYRITGKEKLLSLGTYPEVKLADARQKRDEARKLLRDGIDPSAHRQSTKAARQFAADHTFETIAREWHKSVHAPKVSPQRAKTSERRLEMYAFPLFGSKPITEIEAADILVAVRRVEEIGQLETAHRIKIICGQVFRFAISMGLAKHDPTGNLRGLLKPVIVEHYPAITDPDEIGKLLRSIDAYDGKPVTCAALRMAPLLFVRPGELRQARWADFDLEAAEWNFQPSKNGEPMVTPLPRQAMAILREMEPLSKGQSEYVFPSERSAKKPMSENTITGALIQLGYEGKMSGHGFRAMARTVLAERLNFPPEYIEQQLAHTVRDSMGRAYNRTQHLEQRRQMLQKWADYLDGLRQDKADNIIPLRREA